MNKTGESPFENAETLIFFLVVIFAVTLLIFTFAFLIRSYESGLTNIPSRVQAELISLRFVNNPDCFAYQEENSPRVMTGVIDSIKFNELQMKDCYVTDEQTVKDQLNFRLQLESRPNYSVSTNNYFNVDSFTIVTEIVVKEGLQLKKDRLFIYVQEGLV